MPDTYIVALTPGALSDIDRLDRFLREKNPAAADKMLNAFDLAFTRLAENPFDSPALTERTVRARIVRFGSRGYMCLYRVEEHNVVVARIFHNREDWQQRIDNQI